MEEDTPVGGGDAVLIDASVGDEIPGDGKQVDAVSRGAGHGDTRLPIGEGSHHRHGAGVRRPYAEDDDFPSLAVGLLVSA